MKNKSIIGKWVIPVAIVSMSLSACKKDPEPEPPAPPSNNSSLTFNFTHHVKGLNLELDTIIYTNLAGNTYSIKNLRYLISDFRLDDYEGNFIEVNEHHLVDLSDPSTLTFTLSDSIEKKKYKSINYYIGFLPEENVITGEHDDLDDANWAFPPIVKGIPAGGYYSIQLTGEHYDVDSTKLPYEIGIGAKKMVVTQTSSKFEPNEIIGSLIMDDFELTKASVEIELRFDIGSFFANPSDKNLLDLFIHDSDFESDPVGTEIVSKNAIFAIEQGEIIYGSK